MTLHWRCLGCLSLLAGIAATAPAQVAGNSSLNGRYYFRHLLLVADASANVTETRTGFGTLTFDGNGGYTVAGQQLVGTSPPAALGGAGTYTVKPGGYVTLSNPLRGGTTVNARLGVGALLGSSTEAGSTVFDVFLAIPAPAAAPAAVSGPYWISSLELPNGGAANIRNTNFKLTANGAGSFSENTVTGQARNLGNRVQNQTVAPMTYSVSLDATGTLNFPGADTLAQLIAGTKSIYVSQDASHFIGGSAAAGGHGLVVGVKAFAGGASNSSWNGFFVSAGLRYDIPATASGPGRLAAATGAVNATAAGAVWARRTRQSDGLFDASPLITFSLGADGSGPLTSTSGRVSVAASGQTFASSGVAATDASAYELYFGARMIQQSAPGVFLHPLGVLNAASFAPPGYPVSPGGFVYLYGSGLATQTAVATAFPFPSTLGGVQVTVNGLPARLYAVSPNRIDCIVPYAASGSTATIVATVNGVRSNSIDVPLAASAPGIFSLPQNGLGDGAILHANFSAVTGASPARPGEIVQVYLTGLGAVNPPVADGAAAPSAEPLARSTGDLRVTVGGRTAAVLYQGLAPGLAGLYQLNVQIPSSLPAGSHSLSVQTLEGFTDMVSVRVSP
jgi:uncharacterized protein (TIGR03437 family)